MERTVNHREASYDWIRIIACLMVILMHVSALMWYNLQPKDNHWQMMEFIDTFVQSGVPLFFMVSGALFLNRTTIDIKRLWLHNILHLVLVYIVWSVFYAIDSVGLTNIAAIGLRQFSEIAMSAKYHLWFIPTIISVYIMAPILHVVVHGNQGKIVKYYLLIFFLFRILRTTLLLIPSLPESGAKILNLLPIELMDYCGYFILGYWLTTINTKPIPTWILAGSYVAVSCLAAWANIGTALVQDKVSGVLHGNFTLPTFIQGVCVFVLVQNKMAKKVSGRIVSVISVCTLGVYLLHEFVYTHLSIYFGLNSLSFFPLVSIPIIALITFFICTVVIFGLKQIPIINKWFL